MKKQWLCAIAAATMMLTGCGGGNEPEKKDTFVVGMECAYQPFNWQTTKETKTSVSLGEAGYVDGYDIMIASDIADSLGKELVIKKIAWDGLIPAVEAGEIDAIIAGMTANEKREEGVDFTTPYYESEGMVMIVRKDSKQAKYTSIQQFSGENVIGQKNTNYDDVIDQIKGVNHMVPKNNYPEMVVALQQKDADGITAEMPVAEGIVSANPNLAIVKFDEGKGFKMDTTVSIAMKNDTRDTQFFKDVQKALDGISKKQRNEYMKKAVETAPVGE